MDSRFIDVKLLMTSNQISNGNQAFCTKLVLFGRKTIKDASLATTSEQPIFVVVLWHNRAEENYFVRNSDLDRAARRWRRSDRKAA